jgi:glycerol kinase
VVPWSDWHSYVLGYNLLPDSPFLTCQDASVHDLARRYYATLEALALQTRHIVEVMSQDNNDKGSKRVGHSCLDIPEQISHESERTIHAIHLSGGQAVSGGMMVQLIADACGVPVVLPDTAPVVLGAAMLGRYAADMKASRKGSDQQEERLWQIMVRWQALIFWICQTFAGLILLRSR